MSPNTTSIGKGHPDPDIGFAEGRFYLFTQQRTDYVRPGPWVDGVEARVGVDTDDDGKADRWTGWQTIQETYDHIEGFSKQIETTPAQLDTSSLPAGFSFQFELKLTDTTANASKPMIDRVDVVFESLGDARSVHHSTVAIPPFDSAPSPPGAFASRLTAW